jgi:putative transposase
MPRTRPWEVSDELWGQVRPLIPPAPSHAKGGRPRLDDRRAFEAIVYVLRTGIQWNALPRELGASSTVHDRFQEWEQAGFFKALWQAGLSEYDDLVGIQWEWQAADGVLTKAPFAGAATGANPTDRGKQGTKRSLLTDGAGIPLALVVDGANRHDVRLLCATLDGLVISRASAHPRAAAAPLFRCGLRLHSGLQRTGRTPLSTACAQSRGGETRQRDHPWLSCSNALVVERSHSWINRSRRLLVLLSKRRWRIIWLSCI